MKTSSRRAFLDVLRVLGGCALAAACSSPFAPTARTPAPAQPGVDQPTPGGVLRIGIIGDFPSLEGQTVSSVMQDSLWGVWDRLVSQDLTTRPQPMLAEHWEVSPDFTQVTLHIRHGVRFHTGRELTSQDVTKILAESPRLQLWDECHACPTSTAAYWL